MKLEADMYCRSNVMKMFLSYENVPFAKGTFLSVFSHSHQILLKISAIDENEIDDTAYC